MRTPSKALPRWRCHKVVEAAPIIELLSESFSGRAIRLDAGEGRIVAVMCEPAMFARFVPAPGDFFVIYEDGYRSFSPRHAFVDGYAPLDERRMDVV